MDLLFTRALIASGSSDATKDAQCVAELGAEYRAASLLDVQALYRSIFRAGPQFTAAAHSQAVYITPSDPFLVFSFGAVNGLQVACAKLSASLLFTRAQISAGDSDATKDAQCVAELGTGYRAASLLDVQALYRSPFRAGPQFTAAAHSQAVYITPSDPFLVFSFGAVNSLQVACARF